MSNPPSLKHTHRTAQGEDLPLICKIMKKGPASIYVRDLNSVDKPFLFTEVAKGPFTTEFIFGHHVLHGRDIKTNQRKSLRITDTNHVVELSTHENTEWCTPSLGAIRLLIPK